jgi:predicted peptidase
VRLSVVITLLTGSGFCLALVLLAGCGNVPEPPDHPRLSPGVALDDVTFHSAALNREMQYRVILPASIEPGRKLPVVYLLHGAGGGFRDWSNYSDVSRFAEAGLILVMPEGDYSYHTS